MARTTIGGSDIRATAAVGISSLTAVKQIGTIHATTYSSSMTIDLSTGDIQTINVTNTTAFTLNAPTNPTTGQLWILRIANGNSGSGAIGTITWNSAFKQGTVTSPAKGFSVVLQFYYDGTNHWKVSEADGL